MNRKDTLEAHEKMIKGFLKMHNGRTSTLVKQAGMEIELDFEQDFDLSIDYHIIEQRKFAGIKGYEQISNFVQNPIWRLQKSLASAIKNPKKNLRGNSDNEADLIYFYGDPGKNRVILGIGKSTAFATIIYHLRQKETRPIFQEWFPFFKGYSNFIMIHVNEQITTENSLNYSYEWAKYLKEHNYMVVIDDAHKLFHSKEGKIFLQQIRADQEWVLLLASQPPPQKNDTTKNLKNKFLLTELLHQDAVKQLENCFHLLGNSIEQITPPLQANYIAYRLWFYIGGNMRQLKSALAIPDKRWIDYFSKLALILEILSGAAQAEQFYDQKQQKWVKKSIHFENVFNFLSSNYNLALQDLVDLKFGRPSITAIQDLDSLIIQFEEKNILAARTTKSRGEVKTTRVIGFHSRRTQYAFGAQFIKNSNAYWEKNGQNPRTELQWLLERIEYGFILDYEVYKLKESLKSLQAQGNSQHKQEEKQIIDTKIQKYVKLINLTKEENRQSMLYYEAYQIQKGEKYHKETEFTLKPIMQDLKKGPEEFYNKYQAEIAKGISLKPELKGKIEEKKKIVESKRELEIIELRQEIYTLEAGLYLGELEGTKCFQKQNSLTREDFTKAEEIDKEKVAKALVEIQGLESLAEKQVARVAIELAVEADGRLRANQKLKMLKQEEKKIKT